MRNYMKFGDYNNREMGVWVTDLPNEPVPAERGEQVVIPGRSGSLWIPEGAYDDVAKQVQIWVPPDRVDFLPNIRGWLSGEGELTFSETSLFFYKARVAGAYDFLPFGSLDGYKAVVPFECYPFRYLRSPAPVTITASGQVITNPYTVYAEPVLQVFGSGDVTITVGSVTFQLLGMPSGIMVDTEAYEVYKDGVLYNDKMAGAFPVLPSGDTVITWAGNVGQIVIQPRWRSL